MSIFAELDGFDTIIRIFGRLTLSLPGHVLRDNSFPTDKAGSVTHLDTEERRSTSALVGFLGIAERGFRADLCPRSKSLPDFK